MKGVSFLQTVRPQCAKRFFYYGANQQLGVYIKVRHLSTNDSGAHHNDLGPHPNDTGAHPNDSGPCPNDKRAHPYNSGPPLN